MLEYEFPLSFDDALLALRLLELIESTNLLAVDSDSDLERDNSQFGLYLAGLYFSYRSAPDVATERANEDDDCLLIEFVDGKSLFDDE